MSALTLYRPTYASEVIAPTSKSAAHRALCAAAFADRPTTLMINTTCEDIVATCRCLTALGVKITAQDKCLTVTPIARASVQKGALLDCGESGSTLRFLLPICAALGAEARFLRRGRLPQRPLSPLWEELEAHGLMLHEEGDLLITQGRILAGDYRINAQISSQYVTGLLLALSLPDEPSTLTLTGNTESAPYIDMTLSALAQFGAAPKRTEQTQIYVLEGYRSAPLRSPCTLSVEGDFSGAAFPLALGAVGTHAVTVRGLSLDSTQGDKEILTLLTRFGADVTQKKDTVTVSPAPLTGITVDARQIPDLVPVLCVLGAKASGQTVITGAARLRLKESDRLTAMHAFISAVGGDITVTDDGLIINGGKPLTGGVADTCGDHRIAMSAAVASTFTSAPLTLTDADCVAKSYPSFFEDVIPIYGERNPL